MSDFVLTTDSGCDLPLALCQERGIIPYFMSYSIDGQDFRDTMEDADIIAFYQKMREGAMPRTSQINPYEYVDFWTPLLAEGKPILHLSLGAAISGSYANSLVARDMILQEHPEAEIHSIDTTSASSGYGLMLMKICDMRDAGAGLEECKAWVEENKIRVRHYYTTDDLKYLHQGGRVSKTSMIFGTALKINPIMNLDKEGHLQVCEKARGRKATIRRFTEIVKELAVNPEEQTLYICHADCLDAAKEFGAAITSVTKFRDVHYAFIGSTIGTHTGPGLVTVFFEGKPRV